MTKIAVIKTGGKQYKVAEGQVIKIEKLDLEPETKVKFDTLMIASEDAKQLDLGAPSLGDKVQATVIEQGRAKKINVLKYKNKTRYLRNVGHHQLFTKVKIEKIA